MHDPMIPPSLCSETCAVYCMSFMFLPPCVSSCPCFLRKLGISHDFLEQSLSVSTRAGVGYTSSLWDDFASIHVRGHKYLNDVVPGDAANAVVRFVHHMLTELSFTSGAARFHLINLRTVFILHCGHVDLFDSSILTATRRTINSSGQLADHLLVTPHERRPEQLPFTVDMLDRMRDRYWVTGTLTQKMIYIASTTAYYRGMRISNVANTSSRKIADSGIDHRYRISDVKMELSDTSFVTVEQWLAFRSCHNLQVDTIILTCRSSKAHGENKKKKTIPPIVLIRGEGSATEKRFFSDLLEWITISGMKQPSDLLFARLEIRSNRKAPVYKMLMASDVNTAIKAIASEYGLNPAQYASRCLRIGPNNEVAAMGGSDGDRMSLLDHASLPSNVMYLRSTISRRSLSVFAQDGVLSAADVVKYARHHS